MFDKLYFYLYGQSCCQLVTDKYSQQNFCDKLNFYFYEKQNFHLHMLMKLS